MSQYWHNKLFVVPSLTAHRSPLTAHRSPLTTPHSPLPTLKVLSDSDDVRGYDVDLRMALFDNILDEFDVELNYEVRMHGVD